LEGCTDQRVLIVDDDRVLLDSLTRWITRELKCEVHCAADREEAEALLDCYQYALVMTDLSLSSQRLEGLDLIDRVEDTPPHLRPKLITLTGHGSEEIRSQALRKGTDAFFEKPAPIKEILAAARELLGSDGAPSAALPAEDGLLATLLHSPVIAPWVQPIFRIRPGDRAIVGVECLSRGPKGTPFEQADAMFAYARRKRAEDSLDRRCISLALKAASTLPKHLRVSVNVHASTLGRCKDLARWLRSCASDSSFSLDRLTLEIVEHAPVWNESEFLRVLSDLRNAGVKIALDDIGLGHSNYRMILDVHPDYLKIDRYFVQGCALDHDRRAVIASIVMLATDLGGLVVAEGAANEDDLLALGALGVELSQSFLLSRPVPMSEFDLERALAASHPTNQNRLKQEDR
jgi:EAL domain-containing protein (putative c-di-GMP-specific phosphodiesterase class I)